MRFCVADLGGLIFGFPRKNAEAAPEVRNSGQVRDQLAPPVRKVIELAGLTPSLAAYDTLLGKEVAHGG